MGVETSARVWLGDDTCNMCGCKCGSVLYDASVPRYGSWVVLCHACFQANGCKLGTGRGQKYRKQKDGTYHKIEG